MLKDLYTLQDLDVHVRLAPNKAGVILAFDFEQEVRVDVPFNYCIMEEVEDASIYTIVQNKEIMISFGKNDILKLRDMVHTLDEWNTCGIRTPISFDKYKWEDNNDN